MTVIACRDGVMAADTAVWCGDVLAGHTRKIIRLPDGRLFAPAGDRPVIDACCDWLNGGMVRPGPVQECEFGALLLAPDGIWRVDYRFNLYRSVGDFAVEGAHDEFLMGALAAGASAAEAVRLAIMYGRRAGGDVQTETLAATELAVCPVHDTRYFKGGRCPTCSGGLSPSPVPVP